MSVHRLHALINAQEEVPRAKRRRRAVLRRVLKTKAASIYLGISPNTLRKWADLGKIPAKLMTDDSGRPIRVFDRRDLDRLIDELPAYQYDSGREPVGSGSQKGVSDGRLSR